MLRAGEGVREITPPLGVELAGFHKRPGQERRITGIRQPTLARALVLEAGQTSVALVNLEVLGVSHELAARIQQGVARQIGIDAARVRVCASHSHSTPTLLFLRQWGAQSETYARQVEEQAIAAAAAAQADLAEADFYLGKQRAPGANHNRTSKKWRIDAEFGPESTEEDRWLDTTLHAMFFLREKPRRSLLWYHFSAHPVCYTDTQAGPDWPGLVAAKTRARDEYEPAFLQGHCGDVNPGDGSTSLGDPEKVSEAVWAALHHATSHSSHVPVERIQSVQTEVALPFDLERLRQQVAAYRDNPSACTEGEWVDADFARDWFEQASKWPAQQQQLPVPISAVRLGEVALLFHPAELYSYYGLALRRESPFTDTLICGYADGMIGYLTDKKAYAQREYAAIVVPKILGLPPFRPEVAETLVKVASRLLANLKDQG